MFSYYGGKGSLCKKYPKPQHKIIIEPFAGSARYSLLYPHHKVILNDKYKLIMDIWRYLKTATKEQIMALPNLKQGEDIRDYAFLLSQVEQDLMGYIVNAGTAKPCNIYTKRAFEADQIGKHKERIIKTKSQIQHWKILNRDYTKLPNIEATWFIDPPYDNFSWNYEHNYKTIDYEHLANWCRSRKGQVIVCEHAEAKWLPFIPLATLCGSYGKSKEGIWLSDPEDRKLYR